MKLPLSSWWLLALSCSALPAGVAFLVSTPTSSTITTTTQLYSIPDPLDTLTSGLASICRLPHGVTAVETPPTPDGQLDLLPRFAQLWDVENSADCRAVRELLTELDVVVDLVIPAAPNSRVFVDPDYDYALSPGTPVPRLGVEESNGDELILSGADQVVAYLESLKQQQAEMAKATAATNDEEDEDNAKPEVEEALEVAKNVWNKVGNNLATALRLGRGSQVSPAATFTIPVPVRRPPKPLVLYSYEGNQFCRLVREVLTELDIVYELRSAGKESPRRSELAYITGGSSQCPYLLDPNTGSDMAESADIIAYLYKNYARWTPPNELLEWASDIVIPLFRPLFQGLAPLQAGSNKEDKASFEEDIRKAERAIEATIQQHPVVVYTYEWSPFCTEATSVLDRLEIPYHQVSLGKEWIPGLITEEGAQLRAALLETAGQSSLPHIFVGGKSIGGLFSGTPGLIPSLEAGKLDAMVESATEMLEKRKQYQKESPVGGSGGAFE
ncbi:Monothiol glutaredoxin [Seminavis robusta]|uniref:Monothiol glutaredoxin n=1 Tax=Seminavis robusta TaxID=568900 RepID=A0A9N8DVN4_9STRA|nr:Monothiol glutaredoxin [Seminavis robusta]|eukprot:Sro395_g134040.1 Monothiol glutaredoxin (500) ;mRNA; r:22997-24496